MKNLKYVILLCIGCFLGTTSSAQQFVGGPQSTIGLSYTTSLGMGETMDFIDNLSFRGVNADIRSFFSTKFAVGASAGWHVLYQDAGQLPYVEGNTTITGNQYRYINSFPLLLTAHYYFGDYSNKVRLFMGGGIGAFHIIQRTNVGLYEIQNTNWHFGFAPEAGLTTDIGRNTFFTALKYHQAIQREGSINFSYLSLSIGIRYSTGF